MKCLNETSEIVVSPKHFKIQTIAFTTLQPVFPFTFFTLKNEYK